MNFALLRLQQMISNECSLDIVYTVLKKNILLQQMKIAPTKEPFFQLSGPKLCIHEDQDLKRKQTHSKEIQ